MEATLRCNLTTAVPKERDNERPSILVVASPVVATGGSLRAFRSLEEYSKHFKTFLFVPWSLRVDHPKLREVCRMLEDAGGGLAGFSYLPKSIYNFIEATSASTLPNNLLLAAPGIARLRVNFARYDAIVVLHETWDAVYCGSVLAKQLNLPSAVLLHNPPFYGSRKRFLNILKSILLWRKLVSSNLAARALLEVDAVVQNFIGERLSRLRYPKLLREYTLVLGSTKATAIEMGGEWIRKMFCFDPGYSLSNEDLEVIKSIGSKIKKKENYIVFGGRPSAEKGFAEALISFKRILKHFPKMRLVVGGRAPISFVRRSVKRLNVEDKVVFTGFVPREKWFEIVAKARLMLYPSHVDAFSYAVLESLHLKTPVVAYRIPAIEIYHGKAPGIQLVEEGDLEAFTVKAIDVLEKGVEAIEPPKIKSWKEIMSEEIEIISKLART